MGPALAGLSVETGTALQVRIGIDTGLVVAGVIGRAKFIYDLWGDTSTPPVAWNLTRSRDDKRSENEGLGEGYELAARGTVAVKGKGQMTTYLLLARREIQAPARPDVAPGVTPPADAEDDTFAATITSARDPRVR